MRAPNSDHASATAQASRLFCSAGIAACAILLCQSAASAQCQWIADPAFDGPDGPVYALLSWDPDGSGPASPVLVAAGSFTNIGQVAANRIAAWDGVSWSPLGAGFDDHWVGALASLDGLLVAAGAFTSAEGQPAQRVAVWNGSNWSPMGAGIAAAPIYGLVHHKGDLVAAGNFVNNVMLFRWTGTAWQQLGTSLPSAHFSSAVNGLASYGDSLYVSGRFVRDPIRNIARWNGSWQAIASNNNFVCYGLSVFDGELIVGGSLPLPGGGSTTSVSAWDGTSWRGLGSLLAQAVAFTEYNGELIRGGYVATNPAPETRLSRWDGVSWLPLGTGVDGAVQALTVHDGTLVVAGAFTMAGEHPADRLARWQCESPSEPCYANCDDSTVQPVLNVDDFTCFINEFAAAQSLPHEQQVNHYSNCDNSTTAPVLNVDDFTCFINAFAQGCP